MQDKDMASIHTLISACMILLKDLLPKLKGIKAEFEETIFNSLPERYHKDFRNGINKTQNFLKHADRDHDEELEFNPQLTEVFIHTTINDLQKLKNNISPLQLFYRMWFTLKYRETLPIEPTLLKTINSYIHMNKKEFFKFSLEKASILKNITKHST